MWHTPLIPYLLLRKAQFIIAKLRYTLLNRIRLRLMSKQLLIPTMPLFSLYTICISLSSLMNRDEQIEQSLATILAAGALRRGEGGDIPATQPSPRDVSPRSRRWWWGGGGGLKKRKPWLFGETKTKKKRSTRTPTPHSSTPVAGVFVSIYSIYNNFKRESPPFPKAKKL